MNIFSKSLKSIVKSSFISIKYGIAPIDVIEPITGDILKAFVKI